MAVTQAFRDAVSQNNLKSVRIMMKNSLLVDPTFSEYRAMENLARGVSGLYDTHDGETFNMDVSSWDEDYMNQLMVEIVDNFSHERIDHLMKVVRHLNPVPEHRDSTSVGGKSSRKGGQSAYQRQKAEDAERDRIRNENRWQPSDYQRQKAEDANNGRIVKIAGGVAVGAVAGAMCGAIAGAGGAIATGAVIGGALAGTAVAVVTSGAN